MSKKTGVAGKRLVSDDGYRKEVKAAFDKTSAAGGDVLERCKRLNELLATDFLKDSGSAGGKAQLKEILGILKEGPQRPSFLDKPPATSTRPPAKAPSKSLADSASVKPQPRDEVEAVIGLLNDPTASVSAEVEAQRAAEKAKAEQEAKAKAMAAAAAAAAEAKAKAEAEATAKAKADAAARAKAEAAVAKAKADADVAAKAKREAEAARQRKIEEDEAERQRQVAKRLKAAISVQCFWRGYLARKRVARLRGTLTGATLVLQSCWRRIRCKRLALAEWSLRQAALTVQSLWRARCSRKQLSDLRIEAFIRRRAARCIARFYWSYLNRWQLGPLKVPARPSSNSGINIDTASLLAKPVRVPSGRTSRSSQPDTTSNDDAASRHRTVVTTKQRGTELAEEEKEKRGDLHTRAKMAGSNYRDTQGAMQAVKKIGSFSKRASGGLPATS